jgi:hypothetical protein
MKYCKCSSVAANIEFTSFDIYSITERKVRLSTQFHKSDNKQKSHAEHAKHTEKWYRFIIITTSAASANPTVA